ncbi:MULTISPECIES: glutamate racemase [Hydrocarboniphaga]|uniref:Glutamate racemase n=1 Tax=Hydrocarboniphaga effusa AP103 TaxID=1172194 RepID=I8HXM5_9GAMM|nr:MULTISPECIES: glutamate racemase [Hydrocarboniphaga]EIT68161.1 glutamate racemase [Hydrocarboniphaga effusa AP103]MDZ4078256.1 glutamate racemase [Hydrocarboniphaga sp.]
MSPAPSAGPGADPIGVFDSGVGGLSVLRELRRQLPAESLRYFADSGHCPYGGKTQAQIQARACEITERFLQRGAKLIVVACNTATIAAVEHLRATYPVPFIGMEPAVKPAVAATRSGVVGVLATGAALAGQKFHTLIQQHASSVRMITQPCPGLVEHVERGEIDGDEVRALLRRYVNPLIAAGADVLVLGCTHYPFLREAIAEIAGEGVQLIDTGAAVARQTARVLEREGLQNAPAAVGDVSFETSGDAALVMPVIGRLWNLSA